MWTYIQWDPEQKPTFLPEIQRVQDEQEALLFVKKYGFPGAVLVPPLDKIDPSINRKTSIFAGKESGGIPIAHFFSREISRAKAP
jgi:hypothetical protein